MEQISLSNNREKGEWYNIRKKKKNLKLKRNVEKSKVIIVILVSQIYLLKIFLQLEKQETKLPI